MTEVTRAYNKVDGQTLTGAEIDAIQDVAISTHWISRPILKSTGTTNLVAGPTAGLVIDAVRLPAITTDTTITVTSPTNNTQYFVYAFNNSGVIGFEYNTTAPDTALRFKTGDTTRVYVGPFSTHTPVATIVIAPFFYLNGRCIYQFGTVGITGFPARYQPVVTSNATSSTTFSCSNGVPATTTRAILEISADRSSVGTASEYLQVGPVSLTTVEHIVYVPAVNLTGNIKIVEVDLSSSRQYAYALSNNTETRANIGIRGFVENLPA